MLYKWWEHWLCNWFSCYFQVLSEIWNQ